MSTGSVSDTDSGVGLDLDSVVQIGQRESRDGSPEKLTGSL